MFYNNNNLPYFQLHLFLNTVRTLEEKQIAAIKLHRCCYARNQIYKAQKILNTTKRYVFENQVLNTKKEVVLALSGLQE